MEDDPVPVEPPLPPPCTICLEPVIEDDVRGTAKLGCRHAFHLDCIGSEFNVRGQMRCPNCRKIEKGEWRFSLGCIEFGIEDRTPNLDHLDDFILNDGTHFHIVTPSGRHWCPYTGAFEDIVHVNPEASNNVGIVQVPDHGRVRNGNLVAATLGGTANMWPHAPRVLHDQPRNDVRSVSTQTQTRDLSIQEFLFGTQSDQPQSGLQQTSFSLNDLIGVGLTGDGQSSRSRSTGVSRSTTTTNGGGVSLQQSPFVIHQSSSSARTSFDLVNQMSTRGYVGENSRFPSSSPALRAAPYPPTGYGSTNSSATRITMVRQNPQLPPSNSSMSAPVAVRMVPVASHAYTSIVPTSWQADEDRLQLQLGFRADQLEPPETETVRNDLGDYTTHRFL